MDYYYLRETSCGARVDFNPTLQTQIALHKNYSNNASEMLLRAKLKKLKELFAKSTPTIPCKLFSRPSLKKLKKLSTKSAPTMPQKCSFKPSLKEFKKLSTEITPTNASQMFLQALFQRTSRY
jgi:hypothetical protein